MESATKEDIPGASELFTSLWKYLKKYYYAESDDDWEQAVTEARKMVCGEKGTPLYKLSSDMIINIMTFIEANRELRK